MNRPPFDFFLVTSVTLESNYSFYRVLCLSEKTEHLFSKDQIVPPIPLKVGTAFSGKLTTTNCIESAKLQSSFHGMYIIFKDGEIQIRNVRVNKRTFGEISFFESAKLDKIKCASKNSLITTMRDETAYITVRILRNYEKMGMFSNSFWAEVEREPDQQLKKAPVKKTIGLIISKNKNVYKIWNPSILTCIYDIELTMSFEIRVGQWVQMGIDESVFNKVVDGVWKQSQRIKCDDHYVVSNEKCQIDIEDNDIVVITVDIKTSADHKPGQQIFHDFFGNLNDRCKYVNLPNTTYTLSFKYLMEIENKLISTWRIIRAKDMKKKSVTYAPLDDTITNLPTNSIKDDNQTQRIAKKYEAFVFRATNLTIFMWIVEIEALALVGDELSQYVNKTFLATFVKENSPWKCNYLIKERKPVPFEILTNREEATCCRVTFTKGDDYSIKGIGVIKDPSGLLTTNTQFPIHATISYDCSQYGWFIKSIP